MAQVTDYTVSNQTFPNTRADINNIFAAIATNNSGTTPPSNQQAGQWWIDTTSSTWVLYIHDGTDDIQFATIDTSANTVNFTDSALDVVTDTTPQLGGDLDLNSNDITGTGNINITGNITASGNLAGTLTTASQPNITSVGTLTGLTTTGDINFGDNDKANFGDSSDLQIYHSGADSYILDTGAGDLYIGGSSNIFFVRGDGTGASAQFITDGASKLRYNNVTKFETTNTGIDVTGTVVSDGLLFNDQNREIIFSAGNSSVNKISVKDGDGAGFSSAEIVFRGVGGSQSHDIEFWTGASPGSEDIDKRMDIDFVGDISFYEDTGTTPKLTWKASEERLGIGTSSPESTLHVVGTSDLQSPIKVAGATSSGVTLISDRYVENESFSNIGLAHSGGALVLGSFVKPSDSSESDATGYLSSFDASSIKRSAIKIDGANGQIKFLTTDTSATVSVDTAVAMTERVRIHSNGVTAFNDGIALGVGVNNTSSNVLDDYEEGTWTPGFKDESANTGSLGSSNAMYTKIGRVVHISMKLSDFNTTGLTASEDLIITGLPFTSSSETGISHSGSVRFNNTPFLTSETNMLFFNSTLGSSSTALKIVGSRNNSSAPALEIQDVDSDSDIVLSMTYMV